MILPTPPSSDAILDEIRKQTQLMLDQRNQTAFATEASQKKAMEYERLRTTNQRLEQQNQEMIDMEIKRIQLMEELMKKVEGLLTQNYGIIELIEGSSQAQKRACELMAEGFRVIAQTLALDHKVASKELLDFVRAVSPSGSGGGVNITNVTTGGDVNSGRDLNIKS